MDSPIVSVNAAREAAASSIVIARVCSFFAAILLVLTLPFLYLVFDLLDWRGRVPEYTQLTGVRQQIFRNDWDQSLGGNDAIIANLNKIRPAELEANAEPVQKWTWRWQATVYTMLANDVSADAAMKYLVISDTGGIAAPTNERLGILSLAARENPRWTSSLMLPFARLAPWTWQTNATNGTNSPYLAGLFIILFLFAIGQIALLFIADHAALTAALDAVTRMRRSVYTHANRVGQLVVRQQLASDVADLFTTKIDAILHGRRLELLYGWWWPTALALLLLLLFVVNAAVALSLVLLALAIWILVGQAVVYFTRDGKLASRRAEARLLQLRESISILPLVKCYLMERFNQSRVERQLNDHSRAEWRRIRGEALATPSLIATSALAAIGVLYFAGRLVLLGELSVAGLLVKIATLAALVWVAVTMLTTRWSMSRAAESMEAVSSFLDRRADTGQLLDAKFMESMETSLELHGVSVRESGTSRMLLEGVKFTVPAGSRVAIVSADPVEGQTIAYLLTRFVDPTGGEVRIDGQNSRWLTHESLRAQIAMVMQQTLIFSDTVANNIGCGDTGFSLPQIMESAKVAHAHGFVQRLPYGYETQIGNGGHSLRIGEQMRIALARAILRDPSVLVIEEPDQPMDDDSRALLDDSFERIRQGRTLVFLSQRQSVLRNADQVIVLHKGHVAAIGSHEELLAKNELYRHLLFKELVIPAVV